MRGAVTLSLIILFCSSFGCNQVRSFFDPPDMARYIERIRESKMSETASTTLRTLADVRAGFTFITCERNRPYQLAYSNVKCAGPYANRDTIRAEFDRQSALANSEFQALKKLSDFDLSGFVSTEEAMRVKRLIELGYQFPAVVAGERADTNMVCFTLSLNRVELQEMLHDYQDLSGKLVSLGREPLPTIRW